MKIAPLVWTINQAGKIKHINQINYKLVHTGQHYDYEMSKVFFKELDIPEPDYFLGAGSGTHAEQTARIMIEFEKVCIKEEPDIVVVVGDVNSTLACSVTSKKLNVRVAHVEAGLRSGDMTMPEEVNRIVTDSISDYLFVTEKSGMENLNREGKTDEQVFFVGNTMIDTLHYCLNKLSTMRSKPHVPFTMPRADTYAVVTLHRPSNVDDKAKLEDILTALKKISKNRDVFFPIHPRTEKNVIDFGLTHIIEGSNIRLTPPMSYLEFINLWKDASLVLTDSGGIQEETTALGIPCFTIRENTERPITIEEGTNILVGSTGQGILTEFRKFKTGSRKEGKVPELWDGKTAERIIKILRGEEIVVGR
jgi:UDP-N-acetylglucosamine 2-epimerase (non-hydrolysing)